MNQTRVILLVAIAVVGFLLVQKWEADFAPPPLTTSTIATPSAPVASSDGSVPTAPEAAPDSTVPAVAQASEVPAGDTAPAVVSAVETEQIVVETDTLRLVFSTRGAALQTADLRLYPVSLDRPQELVRLFSSDPIFWHLPQSGLVSTGQSTPTHETVYTSAQREWRLESGRDQLEVPFEWRDGERVVRKIYRFERGSYTIGVRFDVVNGGTEAWPVAAYRQLQRVIPPRPESGFFLSNPETYAYIGAALWSPQGAFEKLPFDDYLASPLSRTGVTGGWAAMLQHHFATAWLPAATESVTYSTRELPATAALPPRYMVTLMGPVQSIAPGASASIEQRLYVGPKEQNRMAEVAPGFDLAVDYGFFTFLSKPLFWVMDWLHGMVGNWGVSIVLLTLLVRLAMYKLSEAQYRSAAKMKKLQPKILALQERYADDRQQLAIKQMELFKQEKANPMSGCLPVLLQIPVFIALYWVIFESVELRQAPFILWIKDLTAPDPYFVLPILNGIVMFVTTKLSPTPVSDPVQKMVFQILPVVFAVLFALFPAGLVLYWTANGAIGLAQQLWITKRIEAEDHHVKR
jgi:YidC/Oxa1 family membrane protein insertase